MGLLTWLFPKQVDFFQLLINQTQITLKGVETLEKYMTKEDINAAEEIKDLEHEADEQRRILIDELNKTFITPIEREDIFTLSRTVDDIIDYSKSTVEEMEIYKLAPNENIKKIVESLKKSTMKLHSALLRLKDHPSISSEHCAKAKSIINDLELIYYQSLASLAESEDIGYMFKMREVYRHLYHLGDRIDESADIITDIIVKMG